MVKGLYKNTLGSILSQFFSKTIDTNSFYDWRGSISCIYLISSKVGTSIINGQRRVPLVPLGGQNPLRGPCIKMRH